jgi:hypothetical protein
MQQKVAKCSTRDGRAVLRELLGGYAVQRLSWPLISRFEKATITL